MFQLRRQIILVSTPVDFIFYFAHMLQSVESTYGIHFALVVPHVYIIV